MHHGHTQITYITLERDSTVVVDTLGHLGWLWVSRIVTSHFSERVSIHHTLHTLIYRDYSSENSREECREFTRPIEQGPGFLSLHDPLSLICVYVLCCNVPWERSTHYTCGLLTHLGVPQHDHPHQDNVYMDPQWLVVVDLIHLKRHNTTTHTSHVWVFISSSCLIRPSGVQPNPPPICMHLSYSRRYIYCSDSLRINIILFLHNGQTIFILLPDFRS